MRGKLKRFRENAESHNVIEPGKAIFENIKGNWHADFFKNDNPITLELACGSGEYTTGMAELFKERNFIGIDIKGARIWKGSRYARENRLENVAFLRTQIGLLEKFFSKGEIGEIWIVFPDPHPRDSDEKKRLTHPRFIEMYKNVLKSGGIIHLKTDNKDLFDYTLELLKSRNDISDLTFTKDLYRSDLLAHHFDIQTKYEKKFLEQGLKINYLQFRLR